MHPDRREFLKHLGWLSAAGAGALAPTKALASGQKEAPPNANGVLVDLTNCVGCRLCEYACKKGNGIDPGPLESYDDQSVFKEMRRPSPDAHTVVNAWPNPLDRGRPVYAKVNCMHCNHPACASACIVGALQKQEDGSVTYDAWKCIGCRYCMIACPFGIPTYQYDDVLTPEVRKCTFCHERTAEGKKPECVAACPREAMTFGKREDLLKLAYERMEGQIGRYQPHVYGEHEAGGTSWLYLSPMPFQQAGFLPLGPKAPPALTEAIQHGVFKYWIAPVGWYGFLASMMWFTRRRQSARAAEGAVDADHPDHPDHPTRRSRWSLPVSSMTLALPGGGTAEAADFDEPQEPPHPVRRHHAEHHDDAAHAGHDAHEHAEPVQAKLLTPGVIALAILVLTGVAFGLYRFIFGLAASTNLDQQHPWGLWIAMDVGSGIALAGGGFVTAALVHIFHREHYHAVARSALLTALLGYTFYVPGLLADIGRWYNIWHPTLPNMWQGNSVLFEVGICVMIYLNVQYAELMPIIFERLMKEERWPRLVKLAKWGHGWLEWMMPAFLVLGVCLSTFHQSSLGNLMVIAPYKVHALWWSPVSPLLFLLSAIMVGFPMVIFTILFASWSVKREPEMHVLAPLSRYVPIFLTLYLGVKVGDMVVRKTYLMLPDLSLQSVSWIAEMIFGVVAPLAMLLSARVRNSPRLLATACLMVILGVVLNRLNVFLIGYHPPFATGSYFPSIPEFAVSIGLVAALLLTYRIAITYLPILSPRKAAA